MKTGIQNKEILYIDLLNQINTSNNKSDSYYFDICSLKNINENREKEIAKLKNEIDKFKFKRVNKSKNNCVNFMSMDGKIH